jgi:hypothetical protein
VGCGGASGPVNGGQPARTARTKPLNRCRAAKDPARRTAVHSVSRPTYGRSASGTVTLPSAFW